ncbi:helix-turn-helix transcriptional regulator [Xanthobacter sp. KR7-225]|uniref:helix-turn-helix transcriptional regulator n=1 Tax=Xanthobacter sp. KR7-225 TaxID=3156613 RepID=UPI0032B524CB
MDDLDVLDGLYEAAVLPELWPQAIDLCGRKAGGIGAVMFMSRAGMIRGFASPDLKAPFEQWAATGAMDHNPRIDRAMLRPDLPVVRDQDLFTPDEIENLLYFKTMRSLGVGWSMALKQFLPDGAWTILSLERPGTQAPFGDDAVAWLTALKPHVARAAVASTRLALERLAATLGAFTALGVPAATVGPTGRMLDANPEFGRFLGQLFLDRRQRLGLADRHADTLLGAALARLNRELWSQAVGSIPVRAGEGHGALVVHVVPMRRSAHDIFAGAGALLVVSELGEGETLGAPLVQALFDLTPAEARVARMVAEGASVGEVAAALVLSDSTVRGHLKAVFRKCGVHRQSELVALLRSPLRPAAP